MTGGRASWEQWCRMTERSSRTPIIKMTSRGDFQELEYRVQWKDGSIRWLNGTSMVVDFTPDGEKILQRTVVDITQRKVLQERLDREQEMYRVAMEAGSSVMFEYLIDEDVFISYEPRKGKGVLRHELRDHGPVYCGNGEERPCDFPGYQQSAL